VVLLAELFRLLLDLGDLRR
jgi:hypothetical protein